MAQPATSSGFFHSLFTPLPPQVISAECSKDLFDHVAEYTDTTVGAWDLFRVGDHLFAAIEASSPSFPTAGKVKEVFNTAGIGLSIPRLFFDVNSVRHSARAVCAVRNLPLSDPLRSAKIAQAAKKNFLDATALTNTVSQAALFCENAKIVAWGAANLRLLGGVFNGTDAVCDAVELVGERCKIAHYNWLEVQSHDPAVVVATKLAEKRTLSWIIIAKNVASIALATFSILFIVSGIALVSSVAMLALSACWLTMKLTAHFYNKIIIEV